MVGGMVGGLLGGVGFAVGNQIIGGITALTDPLLLYPKYAAQEFFRSGMPDVNMGITTWLNSETDLAALQSLFHVNNLETNENANNRHKIYSAKWNNAYLRSILPHLSIEQLTYCYNSGIISSDEYKQLAKLYKFRKGHLVPMQEMLYAKFDSNVILNNYYRGLWDKERTVNAIRRFHGCTENDSNTIIDGSLFIPPPGDLLRFAVRGVYNENEVKDFGLDDEYGTISDILPWAKAIGITENTTIGKGQGAVTRNIMKDYWRAHWQLMSPQQGYEALHRLRADRIDRFTQLVPGVKVFDFGQLNILLKALDYVPTQRKWLAAISYKQLGRIDLRRIYRDDVIDDKELKEQYLDLGYNPTDAQYLLDWSVKEKKDKEDKEKDKKQKEANGKLITEIYNAYYDGSLGKSVATNELLLLDDNADRVINNIDAIDIKINRYRVKSLIKMIHDEFFLGLYEGTEAVSELIQGGVDDIRASQYVIRWQRQLSRPRRVASINTVMDWYKRLLIDFTSAAKRLNNLGVSNEETLLYLEASNQDIQKRIVQEQARQARTEKQQVEESKRLLKELQAAHNQAKSVLNSYSSIATMKSWYLKGLIDEASVIQRMQFLDIPIVDIERYLTDWNKG